MWAITNTVSAILDPSNMPQDVRLPEDWYKLLYLKQLFATFRMWTSSSSFCTLFLSKFFLRYCNSVFTALNKVVHCTKVLSVLDLSYTSLAAFFCGYQKLQVLWINGKGTFTCFRVYHIVHWRYALQISVMYRGAPFYLDINLISHFKVINKIIKIQLPLSPSLYKVDNPIIFGKAYSAWSTCYVLLSGFRSISLRRRQ